VEIRIEELIEVLAVKGARLEIKLEAEITETLVAEEMELQEDKVEVEIMEGKEMLLQEIKVEALVNEISKLEANR
jgi:hypothetical protein